jgi:TLC domain
MDVVGKQRQMARRGGSAEEMAPNASSNNSQPAAAGPSPPSASAPPTASPSGAFRNLRERVAAAAAASPHPVFLRRRSRSVDEVMLLRHRNNSNSQNHHRLLEDHYRVDRVKNNPRTLVVLPGVPAHEDDWARDSHDFFNLVVLVPVVVLNVMNWNWEKLMYGTGAKQAFSIQRAWTGEWFYWFFAVTLLYFLTDLVWIVSVPTCVKSPATIIQHHVATMLYILIPYFQPDYQWCMGACMIVEVNTWFLIARRVFNKQGFPPWILNLSIVSIRVKLISIFFYLTWILIRCCLYPYLLVEFTNAWLEHSQRVGTKWNVILLSVPLHAAFCLLNLRWTHDLLMSKIRYWRRVSGTGGKGGTASHKVVDNSHKGL